MGDRNYQELVKKVTMYLDNELSERDERELLAQIQSNPMYLKVLSQENLQESKEQKAITINNVSFSSISCRTVHVLIYILLVL